MKIIDNVVDFFGEKLIDKYRYNLDKDDLNLSTAYRRYLPDIKKAYGEAYYWHGTGRFHYHVNGESKYHSEITHEIDDVLVSIIKSKGLLPKYDFWTKIRSISFTKNRIYARAYAEFHQDENTPISYVFGSTNFWFWILATKQLWTGSIVANIRNVIKNFGNKDFKKDFCKWASYVQSDKRKQLVSMFTFYKLRSSISDNYGLIFGVKKEHIKEIRYHSLIERFESRCDHLVGFDKMTHLEVPLKNLEETLAILRKNRIKLPVLPIELCEIYLNSLDFRGLSN